MKSHDVVIIGGGPAASVSALHLLEAGLTPVILEKETFPRYHIGESLTGECGGILKRLGLTQQMSARRYPIKYGVNVYGPEGKNTFWVGVQERDAANQLRPTWTWQVRRSTFDQMLLEEAIARGAVFLPCRAVDPIVEADAVKGVRFATPQGALEDLRADVVLDASGQATFLASRGVTSRKERGSYDKQVAFFSQVVGALRDPGEASGNTLIFYRQKNHWAWFIPLDDEVVSVGVVVPSDYYKQHKLSQEAFLRQELYSLNTELSKRLLNVQFVEEVRSISNYSYRIRHFTGKGFLCVGDSHRFVDPIFSFGVFFATKEAEYAAHAVQQYCAGKHREAANPFAHYEQFVDKGQDIIQDLIDCFWEFPLAFLIFVHHRYQEDMIDLFAGRLYGEEADQSQGVKGMRRLLASHQWK